MRQCTCRVIVIDHPVVRAGLRGMLERQPNFEVFGKIAAGTKVVEYWRPV